MIKGVILDLKTLSLENSDLSPLLELDIDWNFHETTHPDQLKSFTHDHEVILTNKVLLSNEFLKESSIKYIGVLATGTNNVDLKYCKQNNIEVKNAVGYSTYSVAQHVVAFLMNLQTNQYKYISDNKNKAWADSDIFCRLDYPIASLEGKTLGIIGYGNIGQKVDEFTQALGMKTLICESFIDKGALQRTPLKDLLLQSDFITLHCPLTEQTNQLVNSHFLKQMKETAYLINTGRGGLINEEDLIHALKNRVIQGAALDVLQQEPPAKNNPLLSLDHPQLIITPHVAWATYEARKNLMDITVKNLKEFLNKN